MNCGNLVLSAASWLLLSVMVLLLLLLLLLRHLAMQAPGWKS